MENHKGSSSWTLTAGAKRGQDTPAQLACAQVRRPWLSCSCRSVGGSEQHWASLWASWMDRTLPPLNTCANHTFPDPESQLSQNLLISSMRNPNFPPCFILQKFLTSLERICYLVGRNWGQKDKRDPPVLCDDPGPPGHGCSVTALLATPSLKTLYLHSCCFVWHPHCHYGPGANALGVRKDFSKQDSKVHKP